ncbi:MAG: secretin N-terminal domain-containing protein [Bacteriovoracia bacterium]
MSAILCLMLVVMPALAADVSSIDFEVKDGMSVVSIRGSGPLSYSRQDNPADNQVVIDLGNTRLRAGAKRKLDTSSFNSAVSLVSPYTSGGQSRVVIQLRRPANVDVTENGNQLQIRIPNDDSAGGAANVTGSTGGGTGALGRTPPPENPELVQFESNLKAQTFSGTPITLKVRDADVRDVLRLIGDTSGFNMVISSEVQGKITLSLEEVPWDQALDVVLQTMKLGAERNKNILRILTLDNLTREKQTELQAKQASEANAPRITRVYPISYADPNELMKILRTFGKSGLGGANAANAAAQGTVEVDARTNSIIVQDIAENIDRMTKLVELLDTQTPQVIVESKVVEVSEGNNNFIKGALSLRGTPSFANYGANFNDMGLQPLYPPAGGAGGVSANISPNMNFIPGNVLSRLNMNLQMLESEKKIRVVSAPRVVVLNKRSAKLLQSTPVANTVITTQNGVEQKTTSFQDANISLDVTPTITNDEGVLLDLKLSKDNPVKLGEAQGVGHRNLNTQVLVESGNTLVIGGLFTVDQDHTEEGLPFFRKIPILGMFFGNSVDNVTRTELFIFVTPRILNVKKAGLGAGRVGAPTGSPPIKPAPVPPTATAPSEEFPEAAPPPPPAEGDGFDVEPLPPLEEGESTGT